MDPSIMKLLEDDEDESMHSGADVEALSAALNRDIGGDASAFPQPSDPEPVGTFTQGSSSSASEQAAGQWPTSSQDETISQKIQTKEEQFQSVQDSSQKESIQQGCIDKDRDQPSGSEPEQLQMQPEHPHSDQQLPPEINPPHSVEKDQPKITEQTSINFPKQESTEYPETQQQHTYQQLNVQQQSTDSNDANNSAKRQKASPSPSIPFQLLIPIIRPHLDKDRAMQLQAVFAKLRSNEVSKEDFLRVIRNIVGDQMLRQAVNKVQMQLQTQAARNQPMNSNQYSLQTQASSQQLLSRGPHQFSEPRAFSPLTPMSSSQNQKGRRSPPRQSPIPASTVQMQANLENSSLKSCDMENKSDGRGMLAPQMYSSVNSVNPEREVSMTSLQAVNKQQQHMPMPQTSFSMYGGSSNNFHPNQYPRPPMGHATNTLKSQALDSHMRQASHTQALSSTQLGPTHPNNAKLQSISNETKRLHGGPLTTHSVSQQNPVAWQPLVNKEQRSSSLQSMAHVKQEVVDQATEHPNKSHLSAPEGPSFSSGHNNQGNPTVGTFKNDGVEKQSSRAGFSTSLSTVGGNISAPMANQMGTSMQISSATPPLVGGVATRTPVKKPSIGQKKPLETVTTSSPQSSKKQKVSGAFHDQSIEHLNDVTAVSGVNLREEEEQLLSAPKEDSRASEATRRVVQEEEEKLILQKVPLQKKLATIMSNCGLKTISSDVERCLSLCVEERLRGLISSLIRLSKQRVDLEMARHRFVITSDVGCQILAMNRKAKEEWDKKQADEAEKLRKLNETEENSGADADKDKDDGRSKTNKVNKEEDDKMRTTAANVAARAAVGGDDMLSKWQLMAEQARQKRDGLDGPSSAQPGKATNHKAPSGSKRSLREQQETDKRGSSSSSISGTNRRFGRSQAAMSQPKVVRSICTKDVISVLEREPQMSKSTLIYRLYEKLAGDSEME